ncbi:MAG: MGH1-like glycoside hydrolase domain-containing protein, partial [Acutalibacteraceae bacterium]
GSTTAKFKSGLLTTYDYFYSTSGMDDYPAQVAMMKREKRDTAAPVITTSQVIRFAKILYILADKTGRENDKAEYETDIRTLTEALDKYSWDKDSGYFGYVLHDKDYNPKEIFRTESGENLNKGLDGIYPIIAGACSEDQKKAILHHLESEKEMFSPYGISAVDQSAGYYKVNGYWNGNIWFPHQWFIWKAMLDNGESDFAFEIARRAIDIWKREVEDSYYTFEMVNVVTGCGGWFHNFGGLSTPINLWTKAYYAPGTVNVGFDTYLDKTEWNDERTEAEIHFTCYGENEESILLIVMNEKESYRILLDGKTAETNERTNGCLEVRFQSKKGERHHLTVTPVR